MSTNAAASGGAPQKTTTSPIATAYPCPPNSADLADLLKLHGRFPRQIEELNTNVRGEKKNIASDIFSFFS
jgi:hypothetical protein